MSSKNTFTEEKKQETIEKIIALIEKDFDETIKEFKTINATGLLIRCILYDTIKVVNERFTDKGSSLVAKEEISLTKELKKNRRMEKWKPNY